MAHAANYVCRVDPCESLELDLRWEIYHSTPLQEMMGDGDCNLT